MTEIQIRSFFWCLCHFFISGSQPKIRRTETVLPCLSHHMWDIGFSKGPVSIHPDSTHPLTSPGA